MRLNGTLAKVRNNAPVTFLRGPFMTGTKEKTETIKCEDCGFELSETDIVWCERNDHPYVCYPCGCARHECDSDQEGNI
jgi:hypothetical protein